MTSTPHDAFFQRIFSRPERAAEQLRSILPPALVERIEWPTLALVPGRYIDDDLARLESDLLFQARWRSGGDLLLYVLYEHQSSPDALMAWRLLRYLVRIWERWLGERGEAKRLPAIVPVVLYHGERLWTAPETFGGILDVGAEERDLVEDFLVGFRYLVDDVSRASDEALRARATAALGQLAVLLFKHALGAPDLEEKLIAWAELLARAAREEGLAELSVAFYYILEVRDDIDSGELGERLLELADEEVKEALVTAADKLREEGRKQGIQKGIQKGIEKGIQKGIEKGIQKGQAELVLRQLRLRFGDLSSDVKTRIEAAEPDELDRWAERLLMADTLAAVFADQD